MDMYTKLTLFCLPNMAGAVQRCWSCFDDRRADSHRTVVSPDLTLRLSYALSPMNSTAHRLTVWPRSAAAPAGCLTLPCAATLDNFLTAYKSLATKYQQPYRVKTRACLGAPGYNYVVGCVTNNLPKAGDTLPSTCPFPPRCLYTSGYRTLHCLCS